MTRLQSNPWRFAFVFGVAAALAAVLIGVSQVGAKDTGTRDPAAAPASSDPVPAVESLFAGIEQQGVALGSPEAPVTLVEYADLQCPYCAQWASETLPALVEEYVETGQLRIGLPRFGLHRRRLRQSPAHGDRRRTGQPPLGDRSRPLREPGRGERRLGQRRACQRDCCRGPGS